MRTLKQLRDYFKSNNMLFDEEDYYHDDSDYEYSWHINSKRVEHKGWDGRPYHNYEGGEYIGLGINQATFCCGVYEIGNFRLGYKYPEHWQAILEYAIRRKKLSYLRTETITKKNTTQAVEKALKVLGFRLVTTIGSSHAKRNRESPYKIKVWEWLKK